MMQELHARSMHISITRDLKRQQGPSQALSSRGHADAGLQQPVSPGATEAMYPFESAPPSAMNDRYEYRLPPGLGLSVLGKGSRGGEIMNAHASDSGVRAGTRGGYVPPATARAAAGCLGAESSGPHPSPRTSLVVREDTGAHDHTAEQVSRTLDALTFLLNQEDHLVSNALACGHAYSRNRILQSVPLHAFVASTKAVHVRYSSCMAQAEPKESQCAQSAATPPKVVTLLRP